MLFGAVDGELELRARRDGGRRLRGRFPYGRAAVLSDGGRTGRPRKEVIRAGAFAYRINEPSEDIYLLVGHSFDAPLASKKTGTLTFKDSKEELTFDATITPQIADTQHALDVFRLIDAGLATGISPGFRIPPKRTVPEAERIEEEPNDPSRGLFAAIIRWVLQALLYELSIVTVPAYADAQVEARNWTPDEKTGLLLPADAGLRRALSRWRA
jgi:HK97 family phage prohead protease